MSEKHQQRLRAIFSDIDGTIVHYHGKLQKQGYELIKIIEDNNNHKNDDDKKEQNFDTRKHIFKHLATGKEVEAIPVPSATLGGGFISTKTIQLVSEMREKFGVKFCVLTGARTSTFLSRAESKTLPPFDFGVCEGGGKIFSSSLKLDEAWLDSFSEKSIGPWRQNQSLAPENRTGTLWDLYRLLSVSPASENVLQCIPKLDAKNFDSAFMVDVRASANSRSSDQNNHAPASSSSHSHSQHPHHHQDHIFGVSEISETEEQLKRIVFESEAFKGKLTICVNLGKGHITADGCTKADVVKYLIEGKMKIAGENVKLFEDEQQNQNQESRHHQNIIAGLFDDENDIEFVKLCHVGFAPGVAHPSVEKFLEGDDDGTKDKKKRYRKCKIEGFLGTEEALEELLEKYCF